MIKVKEAIIVEGKYDKIKLSSFIDGIIIETHGFRIFKDKNQMDMIRHLADIRGILVLTDSDGAGFVIRSHLSGAIPPEKIKHAYIPDIFGKERRKEKPSKEGKLGVEGVPVDVILKALRTAGATCEDYLSDKPQGRQITKTDLYEAGLTGSACSTEKRLAFLKKLGLPEHLSCNAMLPVLNGMMNYNDFYLVVEEIFGADPKNF